MAKRPQFLEADGKTITQAWKDAFTFKVEHPQFGTHIYVPTAKGLDFHESDYPNEIIEGPRGTGKSTILRNDAHMRALSCPNYNYLIIRRTMPELKKSHLRANLLPNEMRKIGGTYHKTDHIATYPNGSTGQFGHCETEDDMMKLLSSEYDAIYFDEITTFTWTMITKVASCVRVAEDSGKIGIVRGGTNPLGIGASDVKRYFIDRNVTPEEDAEYDPNEFHSIKTVLDDNPYIDKKQYIKRLSNLPEHVRRAWLDGEWIVEGAYFHDFKPMKDKKPWHVTGAFPIVRNHSLMSFNWYSREVEQGDAFNWIQIYRAIDWGFSPDPCVCLWIAVLPNTRAFVFKERTWHSTTAKQVAADIKTESRGMRIVDTYCDPTMFSGSDATEHVSIGDIFEDNGVPLYPAINDRAAAGFAIHEYLNTILEDEHPKIQIYDAGCPMLIRTFPEMRVHKTDPRKIADGNDHWVIALAYYCMGRVGVSKECEVTVNKPWMRKKQDAKAMKLGRESVRNARFGK